MHWVVYALTCAFALASADALSKKELASESAPLIVWVRNGYALPFLLLVVPFVPVPELDAVFWRSAAAALPCDIVALWLYVQAIKVSPLSLTLPFLSLTPAFLLLTSWLILGEFPDGSGLLGVLLIVLGAYTLNLRDWRRGFLAPLRAIARERGSLLMIVVAFIYSLSSNFGKLAVLHSEPLFFGVYYEIALGLALLPMLCFVPRGQGRWRGIFNHPARFLAIGFFIALMVLTHFLALELTLVPYMIAVKRTSLLFGIAYGGLFFKEEDIGARFFGGLLMLAGVVLILL